MFKACIGPFGCLISKIGEFLTEGDLSSTSSTQKLLGRARKGYETASAELGEFAKIDFS